MQTDRALLNAAAGVPFVWSLGDTSECERSHVDRVQILLPRDKFPEIATPLDALLGSVVRTGLGATLGAYILTLEEWLPSVPSGALPGVGQAVESMLAACLAPTADRLRGAADEMGGFRAEQVRRTIRRHLKSPSLSPETLCRMLGMSRSSLYRLFDGCGGITHYIQRQRLRHAHAVLSDPKSRLSISALSDDLCFNDLSSFSRAFRREFGCSPRDLRSAAVHREDTEPAKGAEQTSQRMRFAEYLGQTDLSEPAPAG